MSKTPYTYPAPSEPDADRRQTYRTAKKHGHALETIPASRLGAGIYVKHCTHEGCDLFIAVEYEHATLREGFDQPCPWTRPPRPDHKRKEATMPDAATRVTAPLTRVPPVALPLYEIRTLCQDFDKEFGRMPAHPFEGLSVWSYIEARLANQGTPAEREGACWAVESVEPPDWWSV